MPDLRQRAHALRLPGLIAHWDEASHADWVPCLLSWEEDERARRSMERRLRCSGLGTFKPIADFDWYWPTRCDRPAIEELMSLQFMTEAANAVKLAEQIENQTANDRVQKLCDEGRIESDKGGNALRISSDEVMRILTARGQAKTEAREAAASADQRRRARAARAAGLD